MKLELRYPPTPLAHALTLSLIGLGAAAHAQDAPEAAATLETVTVTADPGGQSPTAPVTGYVAKRALSATKTDTPLIETPQAISVVTRDEMDAQGVTTLRETTRYTAGVMSNYYDSRVDSFSARGGSVRQYLDGMLRGYGRIPTHTFISEPAWDKYDTRNRSIGYLFSHRLNADWTVRQNLRRTVTDVDYRTLYTSFRANPATGRPARPVFNADNLTFPRDASWQKNGGKMLLVDTQLEGHMRTAGLRRRAVAAVPWAAACATRARCGRAPPPSARPAACWPTPWWPTKPATGAWR